MSKSYCIAFKGKVFGAVLLAAMSLSALPAFAEEVLRYISFTVAGPEHAKELDKLVPAKIYDGAKGLVWVKFYFDPSTAERGSVSLWKSRADMDAFLNSDAYKALFPGKVKPHIKGEITVKVYPVVAGK